MHNEKITANFATEIEAIAYRDGIRMLSDLFPDRDIRVSVWAPFTGSRNRMWTVNVQALVA